MWFYLSNSLVARDQLVDDIHGQTVRLFTGPNTAPTYADLPELMRRQVERLQAQAQAFLDGFAGDVPPEWKVAYECSCQIPGRLIPWGEEDDDRVTVGSQFSFVEYVGIQD